MSNDEVRKGRELTEEELVRYHDGMALLDMTKSRGFAVLRKWLEDRAYHSWVDPREAMSQEEWLWREMNLFHNATVAREILESIQQGINDAEYLDKVKTGEIVPTRPMRI